MREVNDLSSIVGIFKPVFVADRSGSNYYSCISVADQLIIINVMK